MADAATKLESALQIGDEAPNITLPTDGAGSLSLAELRGDKNVVVYFYPKDDTPGCTTEAKDFRDQMDGFRAADTVVIGISKDSCVAHDKFKSKYDLNFALASDEEGEACAAYGVWAEKNMYGKKYMGIERSTFLIDKQGKIAAIWNKVKVPGHVAEVLKAAQAL